MESTGVVRKVDELGRIVIPIEIRRVLDIEIKDPVEIFVEEDMIILRKYKPENACTITGELTDENKVYGNGKFILSPKGLEILRRELNEDR